MSNTNPITVLACVLVGAVAIAAVSYLASAPRDVSVEVSLPDGLPKAAGSAHWGAVATPNHDPDRISRRQRPTAVAEGTPNHDPHRSRRTQRPTAAAEATPNPHPLRVSLMQPPTAEAVATPNHDPHRVRPMPELALNPATVRAEPEPAAASAAPSATPSAVAFVDADTMLYAKDSARLRAGPGTAADVLTRLAADTPLHASARSTGGAWWRVSLADGRTGYVHRTAVTRNQVAKVKRPAPAPIVAAAPPQSASASNSQGLLGYVDETMNWLADAAARGSAPAAVRTEH